MTFFCIIRNSDGRSFEGVSEMKSAVLDVVLNTERGASS